MAIYPGLFTGFEKLIFTQWFVLSPETDLCIGLRMEAEVASPMPLIQGQYESSDGPSPPTRLDFVAPSSDEDGLSQRLSREAQMLGRGVGAAFVQTALHPTGKLPELVSSVAIGSALGVVNRLGAEGKFVAACAGGVMLAKAGYDELTGERWSKLASAVKDTWHGGARMERNVAITRDSLGAFLVDTGIGYAAMGASSLVTSRLAAPHSLVKYALRQAENGKGSAALSLQNRFESAAGINQAVGNRLEVITHSQPAQPGSPRGDLVRVVSTADDQILFASMDVEGHGLHAAKKSLSANVALDNALPGSGAKNTSEILGLIDSKLSASDDLSVTAALSRYTPGTHTLETSTASSQAAFLVKHDGTVRPLARADEGLPLGVELYERLPAGNDVVRLDAGDTVVLASDGVFDRFGYGDRMQGFEDFLRNIGPHPERIRQGILQAAEPVNGADDASFIIFRRPEAQS